MELKEFVKSSLTEVLQGVEEAKEELGTNASGSSKVSPTQTVIEQDKTYSAFAEGKRDDHEISPVFLINFDVAVTISATKSGKGGGGISVLGAKIGGEGAISGEESRASRIRFSVPVVMP